MVAKGTFIYLFKYSTIICRLQGLLSCLQRNLSFNEVDDFLPIRCQKTACLPADNESVIHPQLETKCFISKVHILSYHLDQKRIGSDPKKKKKKKKEKESFLAALGTRDREKPCAE